MDAEGSLSVRAASGRVYRRQPEDAPLITGPLRSFAINTTFLGRMLHDDTRLLSPR